MSLSTTTKNGPTNSVLSVDQLYHCFGMPLRNLVGSLKLEKMKVLFLAVFLFCGCSDQSERKKFTFLFKEGFTGWVIVELVANKGAQPANPKPIYGISIPEGGSLELENSLFPKTFTPRYAYLREDGVIRGIFDFPGTGVHAEKYVSTDTGRKFYVFYLGSENDESFSSRPNIPGSKLPKDTSD